MSLDGFVCGPNETPDNGLGDNGRRLHWWFGEGAENDPERHRRRRDGRDHGDRRGGRGPRHGRTGGLVEGRPPRRRPDLHPQPHRTAADVEQWPLITVLDDAAEAITRAKEAAGDRDVLVHGVGCAAGGPSAGVLDEVQLHLVPTILGEGRRLFEGIGAEPHEFELIRNVEAPASPTSAIAW